MEFLSAEYGWTPDEIKQMGYEDVACYLKINSVKHKINQLENKKNGRK